jgi:hypothetical protein
VDSKAVFQHRLGHLRDEGQRLRAALSTDTQRASDHEALGRWQRECAATISQLSGGSKAHWLSRAFSEALLVPAASGDLRARDASSLTIVDRLLGVLDQADRSVSLVDENAAPGPPPRPRFLFIANPALRARLEQAYLDGQAALERGESALALVTFSSILETIITEALERRGPAALSALDAPAGPIVEWPFAARIRVAERAALISRGCARLPDVAKEYRALIDAADPAVPVTAITRRDAKLTSDVLHVILRDLAPGR